MKDFQTVAIFNFAHEIIILKTILDNENIPYLFQNENLISLDPLATYAYGGIILKVHQSNVEKVKEILNNLNTRLTIVD